VILRGTGGNDPDPQRLTHPRELRCRPFARALFPFCGRSHYQPNVERWRLTFGRFCRMITSLERAHAERFERAHDLGVGRAEVTWSKVRVAGGRQGRLSSSGICLTTLN
jgi:hypothetical protein